MSNTQKEILFKIENQFNLERERDDFLKAVVALKVKTFCKFLTYLRMAKQLGAKTMYVELKKNGVDEDSIISVSSFSFMMDTANKENHSKIKEYAKPLLTLIQEEQDYEDRLEQVLVSIIETQVAGCAIFELDEDFFNSLITQFAQSNDFFYLSAKLNITGYSAGCLEQAIGVYVEQALVSVQLQAAPIDSGSVTSKHKI